ncbi:MAG: hypothetical protein AUK47_24570 [Deltaproteobacteria bacterium CG2_30_63_29]|nr:MAG: hypothetical protein AUK47_24570 [Deltaproteobacteria bacterium CG2_30_63_29]PJB42427.1 MAG: DUF4440 domain-containing protein [Deltaproteobacteria bacterium CG_4_9_14_3_um_filter_63_12]
MTPTQIADTFYSAFQAKDHATMRACYSSDAAFSDPVFTDLHGEKIGDMWQMLCEQGRDLTLTYEVLHADEDCVRVRWLPTYTFSVTGRKVVNDVVATLKIVDGKIANHADDFDLWKWTRMALGLPGRLLGWTSFVQNRIRKEAGKGLDKFVTRQAA